VAGGRVSLTEGAQPERNDNTNLRVGERSAHEWVASLPKARQRDQGEAMLDLFVPVEEAKRVGALGQAVEGQFAVADDRGTPQDRVDAGDLPAERPPGGHRPPPGGR